MEAVAYVQLLNASSEPKDWCIVSEAMIEMDEAALAEKVAKDISKQPLFRWL